MSSREAGKEVQNILKQNFGPDKGNVVTVKKLEGCLDEIGIKISSAKREMKSIIEAHSTQFEKAFELSDIATDKISDAKQMIQRAFNSLSSSKDSLRTELKGNVDKYKALVKNYQLSKAAIKILASLALFQKNIMSFEQWLVDGKYAECANVVAQNEALLTELSSKDAAIAAADPEDLEGVSEVVPTDDSLLSPRILTILRMSHSKKKVRLTNRIKRCMAAAVKVTTDSDGGQVSISTPVLGSAPHHLHVSHPVALPTFFKAADILGQFDVIVAPLARAIVDNFLVAVISQNRQVEVVSEVAGGVSKVRLALAAASKSDTPDGNIGNVRSVLDQFAKVMGVLHQRLLGGELEFAGRLGALLFSNKDPARRSVTNLENCLVGMLKRALPASLSELKSQKQQFAAVLDAFVEKLTSFGFVRRSKDAGENSENAAAAVTLPALESFGSELALHFVTSERESMLKAARDLISKDAFNSQEVGAPGNGEWNEAAMTLPIGASHPLSPIFGDHEGGLNDSSTLSSQGSDVTGSTNDDGSTSTATDSATHSNTHRPKRQPVSFLSFPKCHVTAATLQLVKLSEQAMERACLVGSTGDEVDDVDIRCCKMYYDTARDVLGLFRAIGPLVKSQEIKQVPRVAMLFHNDCMFIAHHLLTLGSRHASRLPEKIQSTVSTVDLVPLFRDLGQKTFQTQLQQQHAYVTSILDQIPDLSSITEESTFQESERLIKQILLTVRNLRAAFIDVLPERLYAEVMDGLLDLPMQNLLDRVLSLRDIGIDECNQLHHLMQTVIDARNSVVPQAYTTAAAGESDSSKQQDGFVMIEAEIAADTDSSQSSPRVAERFRLVASVLSDSLASITDAYRNDRSYQTHLRPAEFAGLVRAVFEDNSKRRALLDLIAQEQQQQYKR